MHIFQSEVLSVKNVLDSLRATFQQHNFEDSEMEAKWLLAEILEISLTEQLAHPERQLSGAEKEILRRALLRRLKFEPLSYISGTQSFYGRNFQVGAGVLIPRPDTEALIEQSLPYITEHLPTTRELQILDSCCGSACLGITLALELQKLGRKIHLTLLDKDENVFPYVQQNVKKFDLVANSTILQADLFPNPSKGAQEKFDLISINPPYITQKEMATLMPDVRLYEPEIALVGGEDGLDFYRRIAEQVQGYLKDPAVLLLEHGYNQQPDIEAIFAPMATKKIIALKDFADRPRGLAVLY